MVVCMGEVAGAASGLYRAYCCVTNVVRRLSPDRETTPNKRPRAEVAAYNSERLLLAPQTSVDLSLKEEGFADTLGANSKSRAFEKKPIPRCH